jgi:hypothetical protein
MLWHRYWKRQSIALAIVAMATSACNSTNIPNAASGISAVSGTDQFATVGGAAANPLVVLVVDQDGSPFGGAKVRWLVAQGGGTVSDTTSTSDANGHASITYTAGANPGVATIVATAEQIWQTSFAIHVVAP